MSTNVCRIAVAVSCLVFLLSGCVTVYEKEFGFNISRGHMVSNAFTFREFSCGIGINARPVDKESFSGETYKRPWFGIYSEQPCDSQMTALFESITLRSIGIEYGDTTIQFEQVSGEAVWRCKIDWRLSDIVIPDSVDSLYLHIGLSYIENGDVIKADTVVTLYRFQEKWKDMWSGNT